MSQFFTDQERIDAATMHIDAPTIGSGFIQHPPQRPFERPLQVQPPTVAHLDFPEEFRQVPGLAGGAAPPAARAPAPSQHAAPGLRPAAYANGGAPAPGRGRGGYQGAAPGRGPPGGGRSGGGLGGGVPVRLVHVPPPGPVVQGGRAVKGATAAAVPRPAAAAPAPVARPPPPPQAPLSEPEGPAMTKAQKQRLRKKLREGKA